MQHQRPPKPQKKSFRTKDSKAHIPYDSCVMEHGDPDFQDLRVRKVTKKKLNFFEKLFS
ncbi:MAG: hypothetical protein K0U47_10860 [Epsilonproteobacteria bacterium]|nr:hypothetical protein [Campylobacterota bacterium]